MQLLLKLMIAVIETQIQGIRNMNDTKDLQDVVQKLVDEAKKTAGTLKALASAVVGLRGDLARTDIQQQINAVKTLAQAALDDLTSAETDAESALVVPPTQAEVEAAAAKAAADAKAEADARAETERVAAQAAADQKTAEEAAAKSIADVNTALTEKTVAAPVADSPEFTVGNLDEVK